VLVEQGGRLLGEAYFTAEDKAVGRLVHAHVAFDADTLTDIDRSQRAWWRCWPA